MKHLTALCLALCALTASAGNVDITELRLASPLSLPAPLATDTADVFGKPWDDDAFLLSALTNIDAWKDLPLTADSILPATEADAVQLAGFPLENRN